MATLLTPSKIEELCQQLRGLLSAVARGELAASAQVIAQLKGADVALEADAVLTAQGRARWYPSTVQAVLRSQRAAELAK